jgi:hypothetical protein
LTFNTGMCRCLSSGSLIYIHVCNHGLLN